MTLAYRKAITADIGECIAIRGKTRDNAISIERLQELGVTLSSWSNGVADDTLPGYVCLDDRKIVGYCFGDKSSGQIVVLAVLPDWEGKGVGKHLLSLVVEDFARLGHRRLFLGCSSKTQFKSHGFYRHLGWRSTGRIYANQDEELEFFPGESKHN